MHIHVSRHCFDWNLSKQQEHHQWHGEDRKDSRDGDELGGFDVVAAVFGGEEAKRSGSRESLNERADGNDFDWKSEPGEHEVRDGGTNDELGDGGDGKTPFLQDGFEVGTGEHETNTDDGERRGSAADVTHGVSDESWKPQTRQEQEHAKEYCDDVRIRDDASNEFRGDFMFKKPDAVGEKRNIKGNNETTVGNDAGRAEGAGNNWIAEEGGVIKNKAKLRFVTEVAFQPEFIEDDFGQNNQHQHDKNAGD